MPVPGAEDIRWLEGGLEDVGRFENELRAADVVVHLAAATGKADRATHFRVNVEGTRTLLEHTRRAGVSRFLFVSSIVVRYAIRPNYHYAEAKEAAEQLVRSSGLRYAIVRPTIVAGPGSPVVDGLARLAGLPLLPIFGDGRPRVQPIHVDDLALFLGDVLAGDRFAGETLEFGGPEILGIEELLRRLCRARFGRDPRVAHIPFALVAAPLRLLEAVAPGLAPFTLGQLALFRNDGTILPNDLYEGRRAKLKTVDEMLSRRAER
jgi:NADH dehydrogenase